MTISNLTYQERARFAYADGNTELAEALEQLAEWDRLTDEQTDYIEELEQEIAELQEQLEALKEATE